uniref:Uncharacterized protein n=1 Tax=Odontella aurita TaxID=265563 RepID=A0A7S4IAU0_9STRA|mmetsp:Transcript_22294/g.66063  ORF Transcript_22294/g.66063 Transcript_22294/m.66063 type:complete len:170 (+) Transcript_22294:132-641(+)|eukprot:CAMPEP_0113556184 /NCGR_PEP_ID=MMETSP0015_2-20120614/17121_1 /TAXON_ID=2838 /ORGANISM="Odontella" /LENGTH=169 /DNA_ID=CAMNT_0000457523 /DNA_START=119 /DNA_END=628 /DNA_ORIENTATION=- /assembly_acc=CAM_ASM_000160
MRFHIFTIAFISIQAHTALGSGVLRGANNKDDVVSHSYVQSEHIIHGSIVSGRSYVMGKNAGKSGPGGGGDGGGDEVVSIEPWNRAGGVCGDKPHFVFKGSLWPPASTNPAWCESSNECGSCCCGNFHDVVKVCVDTSNPGQGFANVCMEMTEEISLDDPLTNGGGLDD